MGENTRKLEAQWLSTHEVVEVNKLNVSLGAQHCKQACQSWCWATCATMIASSFTSVGDCTSAEQSVVQHEIDPSCDTSCPSGVCNNGGTGEQIADAVAYLGGPGDYGYSNSALSEGQLQSALQSGPIAVLVDCGSYGGHGIFVSSMNGGSYGGHDPEGYNFNVPYSGLTTYIPSYLPAAHC